MNDKAINHLVKLTDVYRKFLVKSMGFYHELLRKVSSDPQSQKMYPAHLYYRWRIESSHSVSNLRRFRTIVALCLCVFFISAISPGFFLEYHPSVFSTECLIRYHCLNEADDGRERSFVEAEKYYRRSSFMDPTCGHAFNQVSVNPLTPSGLLTIHVCIP